MAKKILLVDDEREVADIIRTKLQNDGYEVIVSYNGMEGVIQARAHLPDMILMDIILPDMDGADVVKVLHDHNATVGIPVIFLSGIVGGGKESQINVSGRSYEALGKPFTYAQLKERINHILALTQ